MMSGIYEDMTVFVTGCGSFACAFVEYLLKYENPKKIRIYSRRWQNQQALKDKLKDPANVTWILGDICDLSDLDRAIYGADICVHSAAVKDIEYCRINPLYAAEINVAGSKNVVLAALKNQVSKSILISSDKAVFPTTTYGKTKALAEDIFIHANIYRGKRNVCFSVCRYGNVIGSSGSVVPKYRKLISEGAESLPLTHEDITRFWFKMENAIEFVGDSLGTMEGGEIFLPNRMPSIYIKDLCQAFGMPYHVIGLRPDEKLHEDLSENQNSGNNPYFLSVEEIKKTIKEDFSYVR
jgi:UDP-N-acetylglucosamine 4,6-dehydratase